MSSESRALPQEDISLPVISEEERRGFSWERALRKPKILVTEPPYIGISILALLFAFGAWEAVVRIFEVKIVILPAPSLVLSALAKYAAGNMLLDLWASLRRVFVGAAVGSAIGIFIGLLIGWYPFIRAALNPLVAITFPIPKIALVPLMIIWFGTGDEYKIILVIIGVFYILLTNTIAGVESISPVTIMAARNLGASDRQIFLKVVLPGALPVVMAAVRIAFSISLILVIAAEQIVSNDGLGYYIAFTGRLLETESVFAGLVLTGILGLIGYQLIDLAEKKLLPWRTHRQSNL